MPYLAKSRAELATPMPALPEWALRSTNLELMKGRILSATLVS